MESNAQVAGFHSVAHFFGDDAKAYAEQHRVDRQTAGKVIVGVVDAMKAAGWNDRMIGAAMDARYQGME